jgi:hypothetical protein
MCIPHGDQSQAGLNRKGRDQFDGWATDDGAEEAKKGKRTNRAENELGSRPMEAKGELVPVVNSV